MSSYFEAHPVEYLLEEGLKSRCAFQVELGCSDTYQAPDILRLNNDREAFLQMHKVCRNEQKKEAWLMYPDSMFGDRVVSLFCASRLPHHVAFSSTRVGSRDVLSSSQ